MKDHYATLEVSRTATLEEIKDAYRRLAKLYHPDLHNGSNESVDKLKAINEAFSVLSNTTERSMYDLLQPKTKNEKRTHRTESVDKTKKNPLNFTIDVDVGEVDLWEQTFTRLKEEEEIEKAHKEIIKKQAKESAEKRRQKEATRQKVRNEWQHPVRNYYTPRPKRQESWHDSFSNEYLD